MNQPNQAAVEFNALQVQPPNQTLHLTGAALLVSRAPLQRISGAGIAVESKKR